MDYILKNGTVYVDGKLVKTDLAIVAGKVSFSTPTSSCHFSVIDCSNKFIFPGFIDAHVHLREPGFSYKETIKSGTMAGASAGYSALFSMPNLKPVPDSVENLKVQTDIIEKDAVISVYPYASITIGQKGEMLSDIDTLSNYVMAFSDDGVGVQSEDMMRKAMLLAKKNDKFIVAHCEDNSLLNGGYIHDGEYAKLHGHKGICSASEYKQIERDLILAKETGVKYHVCHVSAKESVSAIRDAKRNGVDVTCETGPHYLLFDDSMLKEDGAYKMNPPIRAKEDRLALIEGIKDGTVDMIATDHAPHSMEEKSRGLKSVNGIVGLETAFAVLYTKLVKTGEITLEDLIKLMSENPSNRFNLGIKIENERLANLTIFDLDNEYEINSENFKSMGKSTPFNGWKVFGKCLVNFNNGKIVYNDSEFYNEN